MGEGIKVYVTPVLKPSLSTKERDDVGGMSKLLKIV